jgi:hypothetical protein
MPKPNRTSPLRRIVGTAGVASAAQGIAGLVAEAAAARKARARRAEELLASIAARKERIGREFFEMGGELAELSDGKYHVDLGYPSFAAMIEGRKLFSRAAAWNFIAIYRSLPRRTADQLGPQRSIEWLRLLRAQAGEGATEEEIRAAAGRPAVVQGRPVTDLSTQELEELRRRANERRAAGRQDPGVSQAHKLARALAQQLRRRGAADALVTARYDHSWRLRIELGLEAAEALRGVLGKP